MTVRRPFGTLEFARATVSEDSVDITGDVVEMAFVVEGTTPLEPDWKTAAWEAGGPPYVATILVGDTGPVNPAVGRYDVWVRVTDSPEIPIRRAFRMDVY